MRTLPRAGAGLLALTLAFGIAACGDDDDETTDTTEASGSGAEGDTAAFCDSLIEFNNAVFMVELDEASAEADVVAAGEQLTPLSEALVENAPEDLADQAEEIDGVVQPLLDGDAEAFNADSTFETYMGFIGPATETCDFPEVAVTAVDYAFEGVPATIEAGNTAFAFSNEGGEEHEMALLRKANGVDLTWQELLELPEEEAMTNAEFVTAAFAPPGESGSTLTQLTPGEYAMICFIPVGGAEDGPPHFTQGMLHEFTVE